ncbi:hypothetical protein SERLA73DRAFT_179238 [Serpula lacrymans var. lacrymans S7.3]|uniref:Hydrophobin n=2 Tax=Serpula lacrymans var. lacrymans TaxID=341189 RepID=F8PRL0_SERL3|nr:hydrophobin [Serpula lacrymans var. lacrymans S7.9]EGO01149.1 hypothetical protein SERLA73DRAFT_179238 [Serpula lacrymans var. lacrymans S7.3]EGO26802.1 hydrophobin [Serpula lacrymans var. lacrymans S7.9]
MKFAYVFAFVAAAATTAGATYTGETNANRMARGLPPLPPVRRATPASRARRSSPSGSPGGGQCNTGPVQCCDKVQSANEGIVPELLSLLGLEGISDDTQVGLTCSPLSGVGVGGGSKCSQQPVCCSNNSFNGLINIGCSPININL